MYMLMLYLCFFFDIVDACALFTHMKFSEIWTSMKSIFLSKCA